MESSIYHELKACLESRRLVVLATVIEGMATGGQMLIWPNGETLGDIGSTELGRAVISHGQEAARNFRSGRETFTEGDNEEEVFFEVFAPPPELIVVGAVHVAIPLIEFAKRLGFRTIVIDPRGAFATPERFAGADLMLQMWPASAFKEVALHEGSHLVLLSHDFKIDLPALEIALRSPARYIGALGSKKTHAKRVTALRQSGFTDAEIGRIHAPIGIDLGGRRAEEIALSIIAQIVAVDHGRDGR